MSEFDAVEKLCRDLLAGVSPASRRRLERAIARDIRKSQSDRIARQQNPDGSAFAPRRKKTPLKQGAYPVRFLYPKGAAEPRVVFMKSWVFQGPLMTGYDIEAGGIRSFFRDRVAKYLPLPPGVSGGTGSKPRRRSVRDKLMFRKLRSPRFLRYGVDGDGAWVGFVNDAGSRIASVHQHGELDTPAKNARAIRYARRVLLGLTDAERDAMLDRVLAGIAPD